MARKHMQRHLVMLEWHETPVRDLCHLVEAVAYVLRDNVPLDRGDRIRWASQLTEANRKVLEDVLP
jgi:hypothetical protein